MRRRFTLIAILSILLPAFPLFTTAQEASSVASPEGASPEIDGLFDVGDGRMMYLRCSGSGGPTVILESGANDDHTVWESTVPGVRLEIRVCAYDRAGIGQSDPPPEPWPRTFQNSVADLHALLAAAGVGDPYVLVGHAIGGMIAQLYAATYPGEVVGLVLVDGTPPGNIAATNVILPEDLRLADNAFNRGTSEDAAEHFDMYVSEAEVAMSHLAPNAPVRVPTILLTHETLVHDLPPDFLPDVLEQVERIWSAQQEVQASVLQGELTVVAGGFHYLQWSSGAAVVDAILRVVQAAQGSGELTPLAAAPIPEIVSVFIGNPERPFTEPAGLAADAAGNIYVVDTLTARIVVLAPDGTVVDEFGGECGEPGQFRFWDHESFSGGDIAFAPDGSFYVTDLHNNRIQKFDADHDFVLQWGRFGTGDGQFNIPLDLAVDAGGNVYVSDFYNHRIQVFDANGTFLRAFGSLGFEPGQFDTPVGLAINADGVVYTTESSNHRVQRFQPDGTFIDTFGTRGKAPGQFDNPGYMTFDHDGNLYVADMWNDRLQVFTPEGTLLAIVDDVGLDGQFGAGDFTFDPTGEILYITDYYNLRIVAIRVASIPGLGDDVATPEASPAS